ncbi:Sorting nexin-2 [Liparis tanakae]|uniref:Sorting nexin-2 n=1 Tax=Liparis tanakae TaxID=230148 RepID=A0A4Z2FXX1_9TELE|nr:Sorting nexin-2 [Liparis tanakae]
MGSRCVACSRFTVTANRARDDAEEQWPSGTTGTAAAQADRFCGSGVEEKKNFTKRSSRNKSGPASLPADNSTNSNGPKQDSLFDDDPEDLFAEATEEVSLDSPERDVLLSDGDGMHAYMAYKVSIKTSMSLFRTHEFSVKRRFSDFLGLHSKLASKYLHMGYIVPPAPEKSIVGKQRHRLTHKLNSPINF